MIYYLIRDMKTLEAKSVYACDNGWVVGTGVDEITKAEYETYKEFGMPETTLKDRPQHIVHLATTGFP